MHPVEQFVQIEAPTSEKDPRLQAWQVLVSPGENWLAVHWEQLFPERPKPGIHSVQVEEFEHLEHPLGQFKGQEEGPTGEE